MKTIPEAGDFVQIRFNGQRSVPHYKIKFLTAQPLKDPWNTICSERLNFDDLPTEFKQREEIPIEDVLNLVLEKFGLKVVLHVLPGELYVLEKL